MAERIVKLTLEIAQSWDVPAVSDEWVHIVKCEIERMNVPQGMKVKVLAQENLVNGRWT